MFGSLLQGTRLQDFMRWIALHYVAANIWAGDFQEKTEENVMNEERASNLFKVVVGRGSNDEVVREVVRYWQSSSKGGTTSAYPLLVPPSCFEHFSEGMVDSRLGFIKRWMSYLGLHLFGLRFLCLFHHLPISSLKT
jgi:hypothetical protein